MLGTGQLQKLHLERGYPICAPVNEMLAHSRLDILKLEAATTMAASNG